MRESNTLVPRGYSLIWLKHLSYIQTTLGSNPSIPTKEVNMNWLQASIIFGPMLIALIAFWKDIK